MYTAEELKRVKTAIEVNVRKAIDEYEAENDCVGMYQDPVIAYHDAKDPAFDTFFRMGICKHPAEIYRPGNTLVLFFLPYREGIAESNRGGSETSEQWLTAYKKGTGLIMRINRAIRNTLESRGRLVSCLNTPIDWNEKKAAEEWSFKLASYLAGMGEFSTAGSFVTAKGFGGRFSGIITDEVLYEEKPQMRTPEEYEAMIAGIKKAALYEGIPSDACIAACPCGAISKDGIDRFKCQQHCKTLNEYVPSADACGKCFGI